MPAEFRMPPGEAPSALAPCVTARDRDGYVTLAPLIRLAAALATPSGIEAAAERLCLAFNGPEAAQKALARAIRAGDPDAANVHAWMRARQLRLAPVRPIGAEEAHRLTADLLADPDGFPHAGAGAYPVSAADRHWAFDRPWVAGRLRASRARLDRFAETRDADTAILVGNGPSLNRTELSLLEGRDVYISNYAVRHPELARLARGVAVSNYFVAAQSPELFQFIPQWKVHPVWLGHVLGDSDSTIWLNAIGGPRFFSRDVTRTIAWHSTVSFFWLQVLLHAGYRRVLLIGFDNTYRQPEGAREGDLIRQTTEDANHFDPSYFRGKVWQAADTESMAAVHRLARAAFEDAGAEIVNCTVGGALEVYRRATLEAALGECGQNG